MPNLGMSELLVILGIVVVLFGAKRRPELAKSMGKSVNLFKEGLKEGGEAEKKVEKVEEKKDKPEAGKPS